MTKHEKTPLRRLLTMLLCIAMLMSLVVPAMAIEPEDEPVGTTLSSQTTDGEGDIKLTKTAMLENDGTYTIDLEAWATGVVADITRPVDMVLVLDQSASMYTPMGLANAKHNTEYFNPEGQIEYYTEDTLKAAFESDEADEGTDLTFRDKVTQLGYIVAQSRSGSHQYCKGTHGDCNNDGTLNDADCNANCNEVHPNITCSKALSDNNEMNNCCTTFDWFVIQYDGTDTTTPWHFYRVPSSTRPSKDSGVYTKSYNSKTQKVTWTESHEPAIVKYANIDAMLEHGKSHFFFYETQYAALYDSITQFAYKLNRSDAANRLAVVGFANSYYSRNYQDGSGIYINGTYYPYSADYRDSDALNSSSGKQPSTVEGIYAADIIPVSKYEEALVDVRDDGYQSILNSLNAVTSDYYGTCQDAGFDMALKILNNAPAVESDLEEVGRDKIVVMFTDGYPSGTTEEDVVAKSVEVKAAGAKVYTIRTATLAESSADFMDYASSDYPDAESLTNPGEKIENPTYARSVKNAEELLGEFMDIVNDVGGTTVTFDETAILQDTIASEFALPDNYSEQNIQVSTAAYNGSTFGEAEKFEDAKIVLVKNQDGTSAVQVSGFDYAENYVSDNGRGDNQDFYGKKLIVTITGVEATDAAFTNGLVATNTIYSGLYSNGVRVSQFGLPQTMLTTKTYVMDYAKDMTIEPTDWSTSMIGMDDDLSTVEADGVENFVKKVNTNYGTFVNGDSGITFTPTTMQWDKAASMYALGTWKSGEKDTSITTGDYCWTKVSVIPANNVYYEDDFITTDEEDGGRVGIEYTGNWSEIKGADATENHEGAEDTGKGGGVHGWEDSLADDNRYSDGSAHVGQIAGTDNPATELNEGQAATATFTFTGTGVDVYSYTDLTTGIVKAALYKGNTTDTSAVEKVLYVDNLAESGNFYQIPTLFFDGLDYGTYTVKITVRSASATETTNARYTYYLDGIRVYNPMGSNDAGYAEIEQDACFTTIRDILLQKDAFENADVNVGAVYIDSTDDNNLENNGESSAEIATYEKDGPKNEVYLAYGQSIAFKVDTVAYPDAVYYLGLKSITGEETTVNTYNADGDSAPITIAHTTDLYYKVTPYSGYIVVENTTNNVLSVTKLRTTCAGGANGIANIESIEEPVAQVLSLRSARVVSNEPEVLPEEDIPEEIIPEETVPDDGEAGGDVVIENPEPEEPEEEDSHNEIKQMAAKLFASLRKLLQYFGF